MNIIGANGQLFGWSENTWLYLDQFGILVGDIVLVFSIVGAMIAFAKRDSIRRWLMRYRYPISGADADNDARWDAIIFTVSRPDLPEWVIKQRQPRAIGLISTRESDEAADTLMAFAKKKNIAVFGPRRINDPDDPTLTHEETARLIEQLRRQDYRKIAIDITGGKTPMSIGAFTAAREHGCDTVYVASEYNNNLKKPDTRSARLRCITQTE